MRNDYEKSVTKIAGNNHYLQEALPGESIFIKDQRYQQISDGHIDRCSFHLLKKSMFAIIMNLLSNF